jgi:soluble cytochrome b562
MLPDLLLLKYMFLSGIIGFVVFCGSYATLVWKKRRKSSSATDGMRSRLRAWSVTALILGCLGVATTLVVREAVRAEGTLEGDRLYAVRATPDLRIDQLADEGPVKEGELLARFSSPAALADIQQAELGRDELKTQKESMALQPLPRDPELVRKEDQAEAKCRQFVSDLTHTLPALETAVRDLNQHIIAQREILGKIENDLKIAEGDQKQKAVTLRIAKEQLKKERELAKNQSFSTSDIKDREKEVGTLEIEVPKLEANVASLQERQRQCKEALATLEKLAIDQNARLNASMEATKTALASAQAECEQLKQSTYEDKKTAQFRRGFELEQIDNKIKQAEVQLTSKQSKIEERARFDGEVIYRHPSPGTAVNQTPVVVFSPTAGVRLRFNLPDEQVEALKSAGTVSVELKEPLASIEQRFPGKFLQATALARDPGTSTVYLECQAPPEVVASLVDGKQIRAGFNWRPPLVNLWPFPSSLILIGLGVFGMLVANLAGLRWSSNEPALSEDDDSISLAKANLKEGDTEESRADTIPLRPDLPNLPRERPAQPWEHPVGVRLREAIVREEITPELLDAVETAVDRQKDAVIVPMREAIRRNSSAPEHARRLIDKLNNLETNDEFQLIENRCLAQRLTFLLYTLGFEIPSQAALRITSPNVRAAGS